MCDYCSWIDQILARISDEAKPVEKKPRVHVDPVIIVHGGAGRIPPNKRKRILLEVKNAAIEAYKDLINGRPALDAVEKAILHMESKPYFNCAKGGSLDINDEVVMDAAIVTPHSAGCVGAVRDIEHPITLARKVMENTEHILIVESGAQKFALDHGIPILPPGGLIMQDSMTSMYSGEEIFPESHLSDSGGKEENKEKGEGDIDSYKKKDCEPECVVTRSEEEESPSCYEFSIHYDDSFNEPTMLQIDAVGVVAFDRKRRLVSGTSTAGQPRKPVGSVSATGTVIGCGVYADDNGCASVSGDDIAIYYYAPARKIVKNLSQKTAITSAVKTELENFEKETRESRIGAIALNAKGEPCIAFKSRHFPWAFCHKGYVYYGCAQNEKFFEKVDVIERPLDCMCISSDED